MGVHKVFQPMQGFEPKVMGSLRYALGVRRVVYSM